jgi:prephenate dehydratase
VTPDGSLSPRRIGHLGPPGTYGEEALRAALGSAAEEANLVALDTNREVVIAVESGDVEAGFVPIENSVEGAVTETLDALVHEAPSVQIVGEVVWQVHHSLIAGAPIALDDITLVASHPQALAQCAGFIARSLPNAGKLAQVSTAEAVRGAVEAGDGRAAIGSSVAAETYGGTVIADAIEDVEGNKTRFVWLAKAPLSSPWAGNPMAAATKTSVVFSGFNDTSPGALVSILSEFAGRGVNMTKIESRPERTQLGHYLFFVDLDGSTEDPAVAESIDAARTKVRELRVLGSFNAFES